jgi:hypothetical protein
MSGASADHRTAREWLLVFGIGTGGVVLAALAALTPWHVSGDDAVPRTVDRVVSVDVPDAPDVLSAPVGLS